MTLGEKIKFLRTEKGMTQEVLAEKLNVSRSAIAKWENNNGIPEINNLKMISQMFAVRMDDLLKDAGIMDMDSPAAEKLNRDCPEYAGYYHDIELNGWNDGVSDVLIVAEDKDFIFYRKKEKICMA